MNKIKGMLLYSIIMFVVGYWYGTMDALSGFNKVQVGASIFAVVAALILILIFGPKDVNVLEDEK